MYIVTITNGDIETPIHGEKEKLLSGEIVKSINAIDSFTFSILPNNAGFGLINEFTTLVRVYNTKKNKYEFMGRVLYPEAEMSEDGLISKKVTCESLFGYLCDSQQEYTNTQNWTVKGLLTHLIDCHNSQVESYKRFTVGNVTAKDENNNLYLGVQRENTWDAIKSKLIDKIGGELQFRVEDGVTYIDYLDQIGEQKETKIALSLNMKSIVREKDPTAFVTRLIPLGAKLSDDTEERVGIESVNGGLKYIDDAEAIAAYGIHVGVVTWDEVTKADILLAKARKWMTENNRVQIKYSVSALDLSLLGLAMDDFELGNSHPIENSLLGIDDTARIIKQNLDVCDEVKSSIDIGDNFKTLSDIQIEQQRAAAQNIATLQKETSSLQESVSHTQTDLSNLVEKVENIDGVFFYIRYSPYADGAEMTDEPQADTVYMGTCASNSATAPTDRAAYTWCRILGYDGDRGVGILSIATQFYLSTSKTTQSGGSWVSSMPTWTNGKYLWIRVVYTYEDGSTEYTAPICDSSWEAVNMLDAKLNQTEVFNRLTNNGALQGLYMQDDQLYINASYLATGILASKDGSTFFLDLDKGVLKGKFAEFSIGGKTVDAIANEEANAAAANAIFVSEIDATNKANAALSDAKSYADGAAFNAVATQTQADVFNILTNNGEEQGLYLHNGKLYINAQYLMAGSFTSTAEVFLEPGVEEFETIRAHVLGTATIPSNRIALYDFDNSGTVSINDMIICKSVVLGTNSLASWSGAVKSTVKVSIDASSPTKAIKITGTNMWGREAEYSFGVDGLKLNGKSLADFMIEQIELRTPPMVVGTEYRTMERFLNQPVYTKLLEFGAVATTYQWEKVELPHSISGIAEIIKCQGCISGSKAKTLPAINGGIDTVYADKTNVYLYRDSVYYPPEDEKLYVQLWYTKTTNDTDTAAIVGQAIAGIAIVGKG